MPAKPISVILATVAFSASLPAAANAFPDQRNCAEEGAFVSGNAQMLKSGFAALVSETAREQGGLAKVIASSHAANCEPRA